MIQLKEKKEWWKRTTLFASGHKTLNSLNSDQKKNTQRKINTDLHVIFHWQKIALHYLTESLIVNHNTKLPPTVPTVENNFLICMDQKQTETQTPIILIKKQTNKLRDAQR